MKHLKKIALIIAFACAFVPFDNVSRQAEEVAPALLAKASEQRVSEASLPPSLVLFASGLFGLGILSRRRRKKLTPMSI